MTYQTAVEEAADTVKTEVMRGVNTITGDSPPEPPPLLPPLALPLPHYPERQHDNGDDDLRSNTIAARQCVDAVHNPGVEMKVPPSIQLEGESSKQLSLHVETNDVERNNNNVEEDPSSHMSSPDSLPLSVQLKGERDIEMSQYVKPMVVETNAKVDNDKLKSPRDPVGTQDSNECCPNESTEPPDKMKGVQGGKGELKSKTKVKLTVELTIE
ncbi:hypothetical protein BDN67DRAFT_985707 [Paxillus ammoniavirescens]|nr:hypothetical protein BDN67DRAFT_985707 [Paxillus ammoniavirescens]